MPQFGLRITSKWLLYVNPTDNVLQIEFLAFYFIYFSHFFFRPVASLSPGRDRVSRRGEGGEWRPTVLGPVLSVASHPHPHFSHLLQSPHRYFSLFTVVAWQLSRTRIRQQRQHYRLRRRRRRQQRSLCRHQLSDIDINSEEAKMGCLFKWVRCRA